MTSSRALGRTVAGGLVTVLTAGGLVATAAPTATAASGSTIYTCDLTVGAVDVPVSTSIPAFPTELPDGAPTGPYDADFVLGVAPGLATLLASMTGPSVTGFDMPLGNTAVPVGGFSLGALTGSLGSQTVAGSSTTSPFSLPEPGQYELSMPTSFTLLGTNSLGGDIAVPCVTDAPAVLGTLTVLPVEGPGEIPAAVPSATEASVVKRRIVRGKRARVNVVTLAGVAPLTLPAVGDVIVRKGKRAVGRGTLDTGETTIRTRKFKKPGRYTLNVTYLGDELTGASRDTVRIRVVRRRR